MNSSECSSGCESGWTLYLEQSFHEYSPNNCSNPHRSNYKKNNKEKNAKFGNYRGKVSGDEENGEEEKEEEEDLSMVSDASSGPPHFHEDNAFKNEDYGFNGRHGHAATSKANNGGKRQKMKQQEKVPAFLDDTASSPVFNFSSKNNFPPHNNQTSMESVVDYSQAFSATHFQGRSAFQDHYGFYQSSHSGNHNHLQNNQWL